MAGQSTAATSQFADEETRRHAMEELEAIDVLMKEDDKMKHTGKGVYDTVAWLQAHQAGAHLPEVKHLPAEKYHPKMNEGVGVPKDLHLVLGDASSSIAKGHAPFVPSTKELQLQLKELKSVDARMEEAEQMKHSGRDVLDTIAWLQKHRHGYHQPQPQPSNQEEAGPVAPSISYLKSLLQHLVLHKNAKKEEEKPLSPGWGLQALRVDWYDLSFALLNRPFMLDMMNVRRAIVSGEVLGATPASIALLTKWLQGMDLQLKMAMQIKSLVLHERCLILGEEIVVTTLYDQYQTLLHEALDASRGDRRTFGRAILRCFTELEACLRDEVEAQGKVVLQYMTPEQERMALYRVFNQIELKDSKGIYWAKLFGTICNVMSKEECREFVASLNQDVQHALGGVWMRQYAAHVQLLHAFHVDFESATTYCRSVAELM